MVVAVGEEDEVAGRAGERLVREACSRFPLVLYKYVITC